MALEINKMKFCQNGLIEVHKSYLENQKHKAVVIMVHGMAEHIERYLYFMEKLNSEGFLVYGYNQRGHKGSINSKADYGYMSDEDNFSILVSDLNELIDYVKKENPELPIFIFGHSMGSFVTQRLIQLQGQKVDGIILSGSAKQPNFVLRLGIFIANLIILIKGRRYQSKLLNNLSFGKFNKYFRPNQTEFDWLNRNPNEIQKYLDDEYCGGIFTAAYFRDFFRGLKTINYNFELIPKELPIYLISGSEDPVGGPVKLINKLYKKYQKMQIKDLEFKLYPDARHEILLETNKDEVIADCISWLNKHLT